MEAWNSLEIAKFMVSILTPLIIVLLGFWLNKHLKAIELENEERNRSYDESKRTERDEIERRYEPHIEFDIKCNFFGPHKGKYAIEFIITAYNKSLVRHQFNSIKLSVRGINHNASLDMWEEHKSRLKFPDEILKDEEVVPKWKWNYIFVEPSVKQNINYITVIDEKYKYITAKAEFYYDKFTPHSTSKVFEVRVNN